MRSILFRRFGWLFLAFVVQSNLGAQESSLLGVDHSSSTVQAGLTLTDCYELALKQSESLQAHSERIRQIEEQSRQISGTVYPRLNFSFTEFFQDTSGTDGSGGVGGTLTRGERPEGKFTVRQPIFSGFREFSAISASRSRIRKENFLLSRASKLLFLEVANVFYRIVQLEADLENIRAILKLTQERIKEIEERVRLGKSRSSELLSVESQQANLKSQEEQIKGESDSARTLLSFLIGKELGDTQLKDDPARARELDSEESILNKVSLRSDVQALKEDIKSKQFGLKISKAARYPTLQLLGNYYVKRVGSQEPIDWDLLFSFDLPLFQGGISRALARESASQLRESEKNLQRLVREVETEVKRNLLELKSSILQAQTLEEAFKKAEESYKLQVKEYRYGLVNNLEVLQAMNMMQESKQNLDRTIIQSKLNLLRLRVSIEEIP